jgi:uncharacterized protein YkvS
MANIQNIIADIYALQTNEELNQIVEAIKLKRTHLAKTMARTFSKGDSVEFTDRQGRVTQGVVNKVNIKYVIVDCGVSRYKVPASMLRTAETA